MSRYKTCRKCAKSRSFLGSDPICNSVVLGLRHDAPRHHFAGFLIGTPRNHSVGFCRSDARQAQQLLFCGSVQIEWLVTAPALSYPGRHSLGIAFHLRRCLRGFLLQVLGVLSLSAARERSQQQNCRNVPIGMKVHLHQVFPSTWVISYPLARTADGPTISAHFVPPAVTSPS